MELVLKKIWSFIKNLFKNKKKVTTKKVVYIPIDNIENWCPTEQEILSLINAYRKENKLIKLQPSKDIHWQARLRTIDLEKQVKATGTISHNGYSKAYYALKGLGYQNPTEVLGHAYSSPISITNAWKRSAGHNKALLGDFNYMGIGYLEGKDNKKYYCGLLCKI